MLWMVSAVEAFVFSANHACLYWGASGKFYGTQWGLSWWGAEEDEDEEREARPSQSNSRVAMIVKEGTTASGGRSSDGSEQEPLHLSPAGQPPSAQVPMAVGIYIPGAANGHVSLGEVAKYRFDWKISHQNGFFRPCGAVKKTTMGQFLNRITARRRQPFQSQRKADVGILIWHAMMPEWSFKCLSRKDRLDAGFRVVLVKGRCVAISRPAWF